MNRIFKVSAVAAALTLTPLASAYEFIVEDEVYFTSGSIIKVIEYGDNNDIGVWLLEGEQLVLRGPGGGVVATCSRDIPGGEVFGEYGGNAVNIDGTKVQYAGVDGQSLAGWSIDCLTNEVDEVGGFIPTYTHPEGDFDIGYNGESTSIYFRDGTQTVLHPLVERIFYYSANDAGDLLGGYQSTDNGDIRPYVNTMGPVGARRGVAVVRETPFGDTVVVGQIDNATTISMRWITPAEDADWHDVTPGTVMADANPDGFILNRYRIGEGAFGEDLLGQGCIVTEDPQEAIPVGDAVNDTIVDLWCQSFVKQDNRIYIATGDSWQNSYKLMTLNVGVQAQTLVDSNENCLDSPPLGDGFGWNGVESCRITGGNVVSSGECFDSPPFGDGFGWNGTESCELQAGDEAQAIAANGECFDSAPLNNGFGWNGSESCIIETSDTAQEVLVIEGYPGGDCYDSQPLGDGFGWNGTETCQITEETATGNAVLAAEGGCVDIPPLNNGEGWNGTASCPINSAVVSAIGTCVDEVPIGDGFGWNGVESCSIEVSTNTGSNCIDVEPTGDGWGWNGSESCVIETTLLDSDDFGCIDVAPLGDGYGWNGTESCEIQLTF